MTKQAEANRNKRVVSAQGNLSQHRVVGVGRMRENKVGNNVLPVIEPSESIPCDINYFEQFEEFLLCLEEQYPIIRFGLFGYMSDERYFDIINLFLEIRKDEN